tara:strand:- start:26 stop:856 length:831 start_codon:yes stop_codon:yes gene_type:complete
VILTKDRMKYTFIYLLLIFFFLISCEKQNEDFLNISITPLENYNNYNSGDLIRFDIAVSSNSTISELRVIEIRNNSSIDTLFSKAITSNNITENFLYTVPYIIDYQLSKVSLIFYVEDINGRIAERAKVLQVLSADSSNNILTETTSHIMYSSASENFNAYDLLNGIAEYNTDTTAVFHVFDDTDDFQSLLSRRWVTSPSSSLEFVKANNLDYANATRQIIRDTYASFNKKNFIDQINDNDVIITRIANNYVAIKIIQVIDDIGNENDRYIFNIKK